MSKWKIIALILVIIGLGWFLYGLFYTVGFIEYSLSGISGWIIIFGAPGSLLSYIGYRCMKKHRVSVEGIRTRKEKSVQLSAGLLLLSIGLTISYVLVSSPLSEEPEPPLPQGLPNDVLHANLLHTNIYGEITVRVEEQAFVTPCGYNATLDGDFPVKSGVPNPSIFHHTARLEVFFPEMTSFTGRWSGSEAELMLKDPINTTFVADTHSSSWGEILYGDDEYITPYLEVTNFLIDRNYCGQWIEAEATMDVFFPRSVGVGQFVNEKKHLSRNFKFLVVLPKEYLMLSEHEYWEGGIDRRNPVGELALSLALLALPFISLGAYNIYKAVTS
ncbi:MAG: hypothetical protein ACE5L6_03800 [Candidatus Bathyarchaeia archaeon]